MMLVVLAIFVASLVMLYDLNLHAEITLVIKHKIRSVKGLAYLFFKRGGSLVEHLFCENIEEI